MFLSGLFFGGVPGRILDACANGTLALTISPAILAEYRAAGAVLAARYPSIEGDFDAIISILLRSATIVNAPELPIRVSTDPDDDKFLACALAASRQIFVSGDSDLQRVSGWGGIEILSPRRFLDRYL